MKKTTPNFDSQKLFYVLKVSYLVLRRIKDITEIYIISLKVFTVIRLNQWFHTPKTLSLMKSISASL